MGHLIHSSSIKVVVVESISMTIKRSSVDVATQFILPTFTIAANIALAAKYPEWALIINLMV